MDADTTIDFDSNRITIPPTHVLNPNIFYFIPQIRLNSQQHSFSTKWNVK